MSYRTDPNNLRNPYLKDWDINFTPKHYNTLTNDIIANKFIKNILISHNIYLITYKSIAYNLNKYIYIYYYKDQNPAKKALVHKVLGDKKLKESFCFYTVQNSTKKNFEFKPIRLKKKLTNSTHMYYDLKPNQIKKLKVKQKSKNRYPFFKNNWWQWTSIQYCSDSKLTDKLLKKDIEKKLEIFLNIFNLKVHVFNICNQLSNTSLKKLKVINKKVTRALNSKKRLRFLKNLIGIVNICTYTNNTNILANFLLKEMCLLRKQWPFIHISLFVIKEFFKYHKNFIGFKIAISGKINGRNRKVTFLRILGLIPLQTITSNIKYSLSTNHNIYGSFSLKLWIHSI